MKKKVYSCIFFLLFSGISAGAELHNIRHSVHLGNLKIVFDFNGQINFSSQDKENGMMLTVNDSFVKQSNCYYQILNGLVGKIVLKNVKSDLKIAIPISKNTERKVFKLSNPSRLVVEINKNDFNLIENIDRSEVNLPIYASEYNKYIQVSDGVLYKKVLWNIGRETIYGHALLVDTKLANVVPAFSVPFIKRNNIPLLSGITDFIRSLFKKEKDKTKHFEKKSVSHLVKREGAVAGVNGSFFFGSGVPVGTLIINEQIISSPLYDRTSLIIYNNGAVKIDRVKMDGYIKLKNGETLPFSGINEHLNQNEIVIYTPDYQITDQNSDSVNVLISNNLVASISEGQMNIPNNAAVICAKGETGKKLKSVFKKGDNIKLFFMVTPPLKNALHVIAGGPRLVYNGDVFISADEEKFRNDVKNSRAARTAVGITKESNLIFLVIEGNGKSNGGSPGASLKELAQMMLDLGAYNAMNLDGGGSSTMVVDGEVVNSSSERPVSNAILIKRKLP